MATNADRQETGLFPETAQDFDSVPAKAVHLKERRAAARAGGNKLQLAGLIVASVDRHHEGISAGLSET